MFSFNGILLVFLFCSSILFGLPAFRVCGRVRGVWGIFLLGKTTRFAQTYFSLPEKYPIPPYRRAAQEYRGKKPTEAPSSKRKRCTESIVSLSIHKISAAVTKRPPANARRRGVVVGFFAGKRCLSAASCFSKKNPTATPQARPQTGRLGAQAKPSPHNRKSWSPTQSQPKKSAPEYRPGNNLLHHL